MTKNERIEALEKDMANLFESVTVLKDSVVALQREMLAIPRYTAAEWAWPQFRCVCGRTDLHTCVTYATVKADGTGGVVI